MGKLQKNGHKDDLSYLQFQSAKNFNQLFVSIFKIVILMFS